MIRISFRSARILTLWSSAKPVTRHEAFEWKAYTAGKTWGMCTLHAVRACGEHVPRQLRGICSGITDSTKTIGRSSHFLRIHHGVRDLSFTTTAEKVVTAFADEIKGKNVLITGTSLNGMGFEAARTIAKHANLVVITCPNAKRSIFCAAFNQFLLTAVQGVPPWSKPTFYHLTDALLTIIEGKPRYRLAFGFDKGQSGPVDTGGNKIPELCSDVAKALFLPDETDPTSKKPENTYTADDLPSLSGVVKTRGQTLKTKYQAYHKNLGATGHGLVTADREKEIINEIAAKFPWYKRMDLLMGTSPIVNCSALAHSQTRVDLGILDRDGEISWEATPPPGGHADDGSDDDKDTLSTSSPCRLRAESVPTIPSVKKVKVEDHPAPLSSARGSKRKSMHDHIQELTSQDHIQCVKLAELKKQQKTVRAQAKYDAKTQLEMARLQHQQREADRQREHELRMMERQMQLETLR
ncbi:hypothetical protein DFH09DRAFT_1475475 [Mycena vulgaris]|nr:hypothetical protein DFH09DRAFT_1475475 [Mycena vulgaris]